jgi:hypothetical protein
MELGSQSNKKGDWNQRKRVVAPVAPPIKKQRNDFTTKGKI